MDKIKDKDKVKLKLKDTPDGKKNNISRPKIFILYLYFLWGIKIEK